MEKGKLFIVSGPSGAGKGTICNELIRQCDVRLSVSMTTRPPRAGEIEGKSYYFVDRERFLAEVGRDGFLEYACVFDHYYGTPRQAVFEHLAQGRDVVLEIDVQGARQIRRTYPDAVFLFVLPPSMAELEQRINSRGTESREQITCRLEQARSEIAHIFEYNYYVVNDQLGDAVARVIAVIRAEHARVTGDIANLVAEYGLIGGCTEN